MKKFLIGGVSLFAILSANNAMAAGYTCEELIEYTSCNPGYYLSTTDTRCPDGFTYRTGLCNVPDWMSEYDLGMSADECLDMCQSESGWASDMDNCLSDCESAGTSSDCEADCNNSLGSECPYEYYAGACVNDEAYDTGMIYDGDFQEPTSSSTTSNCLECPAGYSCAGGKNALSACSGETYADVAGLAACKSCRDAAGTIGVTDGMIDSITGGTTCTYDLKITANHAVIDGVTCSLNEYEPDSYCEFNGGSATVKCDAGYQINDDYPSSDCTEDYPGWYGCSALYGNIDNMIEMFSCTQVPVGSFSPAGSWNAYKCPTITDAAGNVIATTTESAGATSASDCFVGSSVTFKDDKGEYRYRENCKYDISQPDVSTPEKCSAAGCEYYPAEAFQGTEDYCIIPGDVDFSQYIRYEDGVCLSHFDDEQENTTYDGTKCVCNGNWEFYYQDNSVFCSE